jgi:hypothetical protein
MKIIQTIQMEESAAGRFCRIVLRQHGEGETPSPDRGLYSVVVAHGDITDGAERPTGMYVRYEGDDLEAAKSLCQRLKAERLRYGYLERPEGAR